MWPPLYRGLAALRPRSDAGARFCLAATAPALLLFSLISGKQAQYLLPLFGPMAALAARALAGCDGPTSRYSGWPLALLLTGCSLAVLALPHFADPYPASDWKQQIPAYVPVGLLLTAVANAWPWRTQLQAVVYRTGLVFALAFGVLYTGAMQALAPGYRLTEISRRIGVLQARGLPVAHVGKYHAQFQFLGRLQQPLTLLYDGQLAGWAAAHPHGYLVQQCDSWHRPPDGVYGQVYRGGALRLWPIAQLPAEASEGHLCGD